MPALLMECAFVDSKGDMSIYNSSDVANAIFNGICAAFNITCNDNLYYTVVKGDTLYSISRKYGLSVQDIVTKNSIINPDVISIGMKLKLK